MPILVPARENRNKVDMTLQRVSHRMPDNQDMETP